MSDLDLVRETFAALPDEKLILLAREDRNELAEGAYEVLVEEFRRRGLDINELPQTENKEVPLEEATAALIDETDKPDNRGMIISYEDRRMIRANWFMFLFSILLGVGILILLDNQLKKGNEEKPVFAFVTIFIGIVGFFMVLYRKRVYKKRETRFDFEKEKEQKPMQNDQNQHLLKQ